MYFYLFIQPFVVVSEVSGAIFNYGTVTQLLENSGLVQGTHFNFTSNGTAIAEFTSDTCMTMFVEPHVVFDSNTSNTNCPRCIPGGISAYHAALNEFVSSGGNFWAQCAGK